MKITLSKTYLKSLDKLLLYLNEFWDITVSKRFVKKIDKRIATIAQQPHIGAKSLKSTKVRSVLVTKQNRLFYKIEKDTIHILDLIDTRINPSTKKY